MGFGLALTSLCLREGLFFYVITGGGGGGGSGKISHSVSQYLL